MTSENMYDHEDHLAPVLGESNIKLLIDYLETMQPYDYAAHKPIAFVQGFNHGRECALKLVHHMWQAAVLLSEVDRTALAKSDDLEDMAGLADDLSTLARALRKLDGGKNAVG